MGVRVSRYRLAVIKFLVHGMKIITWNCNGAFRKKFLTIASKNADIAVIQECEDPKRSNNKDYAKWANNFLWQGVDKNKGLGVFCKSTVLLERLDWPDNLLQMFLPCRINQTFNLVGVWTKHANSPNFRYIGQLWKYLQLHQDKLKDYPSVICGDLNSNSIWDEWDRWWNHSDVVRQLDELNMKSIYHDFYGEEQGKESLPTLFFRRKTERPYHVDYAFVSKALFSKESNVFEIGNQKDWLAHSDHMPLVFTIR